MGNKLLRLIERVNNFYWIKGRKEKRKGREKRRRKGKTEEGSIHLERKETIVIITITYQHVTEGICLQILICLLIFPQAIFSSILKLRGKILYNSPGY